MLTRRLAPLAEWAVFIATAAILCITTTARL